MKTTRIQELLEKHIAFECNPSEQEELARLIESIQDDELSDELLNLLEKYQPTDHISTAEKEQKLKAILQAGKPKIKLHRKVTRYYGVAAAVAAAIVVIFTVNQFYFYKDKKSSNELAIVIKAPKTPSDVATSYTRNMTLPDGSTVILKAGSTLNYPEKFDGKIREVTLSGEAYFDIKHDEAHRFVIHTGKVTTTVLGTAFDIKAWPNDKKVTVSVTRGRVKVEDKDQVLAILKANEQVSYITHSAEKTQQKVDAEEIVTEWSQRDLTFDGATLQEIASVLSRRYGINISIDDPTLAHTQTVISFSGTESLQSILDIVCTINSQTTYNITNNEVHIKKLN